MKNYLQIFKERFSDEFNEREFSVRDFSLASGIHFTIVYDYLKGACFPSTENAMKLSDSLSCPLDYLFGLSEDFSPRSFERVATVSERVKEIIDNSGKTRYRIMKDYGFRGKDLYVWYHGTVVPSLETLLKFTEIFDCSLDYLVGRKV